MSNSDELYEYKGNFVYEINDRSGETYWVLAEDIVEAMNLLGSVICNFEDEFKDFISVRAITNSEVEETSCIDADCCRSSLGEFILYLVSDVETSEVSFVIAGTSFDAL